MVWQGFFEVRRLSCRVSQGLRTLFQATRASWQEGKRYVRSSAGSYCRALAWGEHVKAEEEASLREPGLKPSILQRMGKAGAWLQRKFTDPAGQEPASTLPERQPALQALADETMAEMDDLTLCAASLWRALRKRVTGQGGDLGA